MHAIRFFAALAIALLLPAQEPAPVARTIILVRHGAYVADASDSTPGPGLSPIGIAQAKLVAARLSAMGKFDSISASPLTRAQDTAKVIAAELPGVPFDTVADLAECTPSTRRKEIIANEKLESLRACADRLDALFKHRFIPSRGTERREILVCHGNVIRYLITKSLGVDTEAWLEMSVGHASITQIRVEPDGRFKVISIGDIGHIPPNLQTGATGMSEKELSVR